MTATMLDYTRDRILVTGAHGFLGRCVCDTLRARGLSDDRLLRPRHADYDLTEEAEVQRLFADLTADGPVDAIIHLAAEVGGIGANQARPGRFFYANFAMGLHLIEQGRHAGIRKFVHVGTVCGYPREAAVPFVETEIWKGFPEPTTAPYGVAKTTLAVMLDAYHQEHGLEAACVIPVNLYGPGDNFDLETGHVVAALIRRFVEAKANGDTEVTCWGTGDATREFLYVEDAAEAVVRAAERVDDPTPINLGTGIEVRIADLATQIAAMVGFDGTIKWDNTMPDGQPRRCLNTDKARDLLGWEASTPLTEGLGRTLRSFEQSETFA